MSIQVLFCNCGNTLEDKLDFEELKNFVRELDGVSEILTTGAACTPGVKDDLIEALEVGEGDKIVAVACTRTVCQAPLEEVLRGAGKESDNLVVLNVKEQLAWVHDDKSEATRKAKMMINAAVVKAHNVVPKETVTLERHNNALVVGGGIAGLTAASELAEKGINVHLIERKPTIGGSMSLISKTFPEEDCKLCIRGPQMISLMNKPGITYHTNSEVKKVERTDKGFTVTIETKPVKLDLNTKTGKGQPVEAVPSTKNPNEWDLVYFNKDSKEKYDLTSVTQSRCGTCTSVYPTGLLPIDETEGESEIEVGSVVLATGFQDFDPTGIPKWGYGLDNVITQYQLARLIDPIGPTGGNLIRPTDSSTPEKIVMIQCVGSRDPEYNSHCSKYCCMAAIKHACVIKKFKNPEADVSILYRDIRASGYGFEAMFNEAKELGVRFIHGDIVSVSPSDDHLSLDYTDGMGAQRNLDADLVVLSTGMVPSEGSETLADMFNVETTESGFMKEIDEKVANCTTRAPGVFIAGTCTSPKNIPDSIAQAGAAAFMGTSYMKTHIEKEINHPIVNEDNCGKCGICRSVCPYEAITIPADEYPQFNPELCQSCGLCVSSCPTHALETPHFGFDLISAQVDAVLEGKEKEESLILAFCCDDCGYNLLDTAGFAGQKYTSNFVPIYVNCMSNLSLRHVLDAVKKGVDAIMLVGCVKDRCHFLKGTKRSKGQMDIIEEFFRATGIKTPIKILESSGTMVSQFIHAIDELEAEMEAI